MTNFKRKVALILACVMVLTTPMVCLAGTEAEVSVPSEEVMAPEQEAKGLLHSEEIDGVIVKIAAEEGVFPEGAWAKVTKVTDEKTLTAIDEAIEEQQSGEAVVDQSLAFDIKVYSGDGEEAKEIQPDTTKGSVRVTFAMAEKPEEDQDVNVYHVDAVSAEAVEYTEDGIPEELLEDGDLTYDLDTTKPKAAAEETVDEEAEEVLVAEELDAEIATESSTEEKTIEVSVEAESFSYYVIQFTHTVSAPEEVYKYFINVNNERSHELLRDVMEEVGMHTDATISDAQITGEAAEYATVSQEGESNEWYISIESNYPENKEAKVCILTEDKHEYEILISTADAQQKRYGWVVSDHRTYYYIDGELATGKTRVTDGGNSGYYFFARYDDPGRRILRGQRLSGLIDDNGEGYQDRYYAEKRGDNKLLRDRWCCVPDDQGHERHFFFANDCKALKGGTFVVPVQRISDGGKVDYEATFDENGVLMNFPFDIYRPLDEEWDKTYSPVEEGEITYSVGLNSEGQAVQTVFKGADDLQYLHFETKSDELKGKGAGVITATFSVPENASISQADTGMDYVSVTPDKKQITVTFDLNSQQSRFVDNLIHAGEVCEETQFAYRVSGSDKEIWKTFKVFIDVYSEPFNCDFDLRDGELIEGSDNGFVLTNISDEQRGRVNDITWSSENPEIISFYGEGGYLYGEITCGPQGVEIRGMAVGTATISATIRYDESKTKTITKPVEVKEDPEPIEDWLFRIMPEYSEIQVKEVRDYFLQVNDRKLQKEGYTRSDIHSITWESSDPEIASLSGTEFDGGLENGRARFEGKNPGMATISAIVRYGTDPEHEFYSEVMAMVIDDNSYHFDGLKKGKYYQSKRDLIVYIDGWDDSWDDSLYFKNKDISEPVYVEQETYKGHEEGGLMNRIVINLSEAGWRKLYDHKEAGQSKFYVFAYQEAPDAAVKYYANGQVSNAFNDPEEDYRYNYETGKSTILGQEFYLDVSNVWRRCQGFEIAELVEDHGKIILSPKNTDDALFTYLWRNTSGNVYSFTNNSFVDTVEDSTEVIEFWEVETAHNMDKAINLGYSNDIDESRIHTNTSDLDCVNGTAYDFGALNYYLSGASVSQLKDSDRLVTVVDAPKGATAVALDGDIDGPFEVKFDSGHNAIISGDIVAVYKDGYDQANGSIYINWTVNGDPYCQVLKINAVFEGIPETLEDRGYSLIPLERMTPNPDLDGSYGFIITESDDPTKHLETEFITDKMNFDREDLNDFVYVKAPEVEKGFVKSYYTLGMGSGRITNLQKEWLDEVEVAVKNRTDIFELDEGNGLFRYQGIPRYYELDYGDNTQRVYYQYKPEGDDAYEPGQFWFLIWLVYDENDPDKQIGTIKEYCYITEGEPLDPDKYTGTLPTSEDKELDIELFAQGGDWSGTQVGEYWRIEPQDYNGEEITVTFPYPNEEAKEAAKADPDSVNLIHYKDSAHTDSNPVDFEVTDDGVVIHTDDFSPFMMIWPGQERFEITWKNGQELLATSSELKGATPSYHGETPEKEPDEGHTYEFDGWTPDIATVSGDTTYQAKFKSIPNKYTVTFLDWDGATISEDTVDYGTAATAPASPSRTNYKFTGWDKPFDCVKSDLTVNALYEINHYLVTFKDDAGGTIATQSVAHGQAATAPAAPSKTGHSFKEWDKDFSNITADTVVTAVYQKNRYSITWENYDLSILATDSVEYETKPVYTGDVPVRAKDAKYTYTFADKWTPDVQKATQNQAYVAVFNKATNSYTVYWKNSDGSTLETDSTPYGSTPSYDAATPAYPNPQSGHSYVFNGWDKAVSAIVGETTYTAVYTDMEAEGATASQAAQKAKQQIETSDASGSEGLYAGIDTNRILDAFKQTNIKEASNYKASPSISQKVTGITADNSGKITQVKFEIHPEITIEYTDDNNNTVKTTQKVDNSDIKGGITIHIPLGKTDAEYADVIHNHSGHTQDTFKIKIKGEGNNKYVTVVVTSFSEFVITFTDSYYTVEGIPSYTYTGRPIEPAITVKDGAVTLAPDKYTVTYLNNVNVGTATANIRIKATGDVLAKNFTITAKNNSSGGSSGGGFASSKSKEITFSKFWTKDAEGNWFVQNPKGELVKNAWFCDDYVKTNGLNAWYFLGADGKMLANGLVQDATGNFYSLETNHNGYYGSLRYKNGFYNCNGQQVYLEFEQSHNGSFGAIKNAEGLEKLKAIYGVTLFGVDNSSCVYSSKF